MIPKITEDFLVENYKIGEMSLREVIRDSYQKGYNKGHFGFSDHKDDGTCECLTGGFHDK